MTRDEIMAMEPGRELDEAVMQECGWKLLDVRTGQPAAREEWNTYWVKKGNIPIHTRYSPSTNISSAWELVEILREMCIAGRQYAFAMFVQHDGLCEAEIMLDEDSVAWVGGKHATDTMPEAICKAYLMVVTQCN